VDVAGTLPGPSPTVLSPLAGEIVPSGRLYTITWDPVPDAARYRVLFARSGSKPWTQVAAATTLTSAEWIPPTVGGRLATGRLQVGAYAADGTLLSVETRLDFVIKSLHVTAPVAGSTITGGGLVRLEWDVHKTPRTVGWITVDKSADGGKTWRRIRKFSRSVRSYDWVTPDITEPQHLRLRVVLYDQVGVRIASDAVDLDLLPAVP
jgi:hypothetical protein